MIFVQTDLPGVVLITPEPIPDERGTFTQTWGLKEFEAGGLNAHMIVRNRCINRRARTLRGLHFQRVPHAEARLASAVAGAIYDVAVDLRTDSPTYGKWVGNELRADTGTMIYVPEGLAHGFVTLEPDTSVDYLLSASYAPEAAGGVRWDDPQFDIRWPFPPAVLSDRDRTWPDYRPA
jgi:dTDP-4-dehydrorhamnose 3,5-epimerase